MNHLRLSVGRPVGWRSCGCVRPLGGRAALIMALIAEALRFHRLRRWRRDRFGFRRQSLHLGWGGRLGRDLLRRVVRCLFDRACFLLGRFHRPIRSLGRGQLHRAWMRDGGRGSTIRFDRFGCGFDIGRRWSRLDRRGLVCRCLFRHRKRGGGRRVGLRFHRGLRCGWNHLNRDRRRRVAARSRQGNQHREHDRNTESVHGSGAKHAEWESNRASVSQRAQLQGRRRTFAPKPSLS